MENNGLLESALLESTPTPSGQNQKSLPTRVWEENKKIWKIAFPSILARVSSFGVFVVTQSFVGHISATDLAAFALTQSIITLLANGVLLGMSSATETLCGQAFGAKQYHMMGIYLQRSWVVDSGIATLLLPLYIFAGPLFKLLGEEHSIANAAEPIGLWFIPILYGGIFSMTLQMFLQAQLKNMVIGILSAASFPFHILISWIFVYKLNWGLPGAMSALSISSWSVVVGELIYVFGGWCPGTWNGFTTEAFKDLVPVIKLSISSAFMLCLELWYTSVLVLLAGYTSNSEVDISAFSICLNFSAWVLMIFLGFMGGVCVRVANELGNGDAKAAKFAVKVCLSISSTFGVVFWILCLVFGRKIPYIFTDDEEVAEVAGSLSVLLAFTILISSLQVTFSGLAIGSGLQGKVAIINLCAYYLVGVPIGAVLAYVVELGVKGIWIGLICGMGLQLLSLVIMTWRIDWDQQVNKASNRLDQFLLGSSEDSIPNSNQI